MKQVKLEIYTPKDYIQPLISALSQIGACNVGAYSHVSSYSEVSGTWKPEVGSHPFQGKIGELCCGQEYRLEVRCPFNCVEEALKIIKEIHPYEEPLINVIPLLNDLFGIH